MASNGKRLQLFSGLVIFFLIVETVFLIRQNRELKSQLKELAGSPSILTKGEAARSFELLSVNGERHSVAFPESSKAYILFILSTTCPYCEENLVSWGKIAASCRLPSCSTVAISIHNKELTKEFVVKKAPQFDVWVADSSFLKTYRVAAVPQTVLLNHNGIVEDVWTGQLSEEEVAHIQEMVQRLNGHG